MHCCFQQILHAFRAWFPCWMSCYQAIITDAARYYQSEIPQNMTLTCALVHSTNFAFFQGLVSMLNVILSGNNNRRCTLLSAWDSTNEWKGMHSVHCRQVPHQCSTIILIVYVYWCLSTPLMIITDIWLLFLPLEPQPIPSCLGKDHTSTNNASNV